MTSTKTRLRPWYNCPILVGEEGRGVLMNDGAGGLGKAPIGAAHAVRESIAFDLIYELGDEVNDMPGKNDSVED